MPRLMPLLALVVTIAACSGGADSYAENNPFTVTEVAEFDQPWAMAFLPDGRLLVSEKPGALKLLSIDSGTTTDITGVPRVEYGGQGGLGDVVLHPGFAQNRLVYLSYAEPDDGGRAGAAVARARLVLDGEGGALEDLQVIWRQDPKVEGRGHYGHRIAFGPDGYLWISSGERQKFDPAQDLQQNLGKIVRLNDDGSVPADNPFADRGGIAAQVWSLGHRNPLGLAFDAQGQLWNVEMGPRGGDELNRVQRGANYGYPIVSDGDHYDGRDIPDHHTRPEFAAPAIAWTPVISPSSLLFWDGSGFPDWQGDALVGGLSSNAIVRIEFGPDGAVREAARYKMPTRIRALAQGPDGALWVLADGGGAGLLKLTSPAAAAPAQGREIALTYDDAPLGDGLRFSGDERGRALREGLARAGVEGAIIFVTAGHFNDQGRQRILDYAAAGHWLANHSYSHRHPDELGAPGYLADIDRAHAELAAMPRFLPLYRYPFLDEGRDLAMRDALREGLAARGYRNGYVTVDTYDWYMDSLLQRALAAGRSVDWERLGELYVSVITGAAAFYDDIAREALGRSPRHVLLLHENDLAALYVEDLAAGLRAQGWTLIPGPQAFEDPIADTEPDTLYLGQGRIAALAAEGGMPHEALRHKVENTHWLDAHFEAAGVFGPLPEQPADGCDAADGHVCP